MSWVLIVLRTVICCIVFLLLSKDYGVAQHDLISKIINEENSKELSEEILNMLNFLDELYSNLHIRVSNGEKIIIFFDPAHGIDDDGRWEGEKTGRLSCTGLPEEHYSLMLSRKLYHLLKKNPHLHVVSTPDYIEALEGKTDRYFNITFKETVEFAKQAKAHLVISEHLNNTASILKAYGLANVKGIHVTYSGGKTFLAYIKEEHKGFLTLYNKFDASGLSYQIASKVKDKLVTNGLRVNNWNYGTVADDRFSYFVQYPISVIFESGFISNPDDEAIVANPDYQEIIAQSHYKAICEAIATVFGIDITNKDARIVEGINIERNLLLLKLSRIACLYISKNEIQKGLRVLDLLLRECDPYIDKAVIENILDMKYRVEQSQKLFARAQSLKKQGKYKKARVHIRHALRLINRSPVFSEMRKMYRAEYRSIRETEIRKEVAKQRTIPNREIQLSHSLITKPIIMVITNDISIREALYNALGCDEKMLNKLEKQVANAKVKVGPKRFEKVEKEGIYILQLDSRGILKNVRYAKIVPLDPNKYQNQLYLKNAFCAPQEKIRAL